MNLDAVLHQHIGILGRYQILLILFLSHVHFYPAFFALSVVFTTETPPHYCRHEAHSAPQLSNCSLSSRALWTAPLELESDGSLKPSSCWMYDVNITDTMLEIEGNQTCPDLATIINDIALPGNASGSNSLFRHRAGLEGLPVTACDSWVYGPSLYKHTITEEWDLVCQHRWKRKTVAAIPLAGYGVGNFIFGWASDRFGRRRVLLLTSLLYALCSVAMAVSSALPMYLAFRFLAAVVSIGRSACIFVTLMEFSVPAMRVHVGQFFMIVWAIGYVVLAGVAYLITDWRILNVSTTLPEIATVLIPAYFFAPESPRWLLMKNREKEAMTVLHRMARVNGRTLPDDLIIQEHVDASSRSPLDLFRTPQICITSFCLFVAWFANGIMYYGLTLNIGDLAGNPYINFMLSGLVEIPAYLLISLTFHYIGRIGPFATFFYLAGFALLAMIPVLKIESLHWLLLALAMAGKMFVTATFSMGYQVATEVFPTTIRNLGLTITGLPARVSAPLGPYVSLLAEVNPIIPYVLYGGLALMAGTAVLFLPETRNRSMMQTIADGETFIAENRFVKCCKCATVPENDTKATHGMIQCSKQPPENDESNESTNIVV